MVVTVIGAGTSVPQAARSAPCYAAKWKDTLILVDLGPGALRGFMDLNVGDLRLVDAVLISHFHMDHCGDLAPMLFAFRSPELARNKPLRIVGPPGLSRHFLSLRDVWGEWVQPGGYSLEIEEWKEGPVPVGDIQVSAAPTSHNLPNLAYLLSPDGAATSIIFTGDGRATGELEALAGGVRHVMVAECSAPPGEDIPGHMNPGQAAGLARRCGSIKLVLSHLNPACRDEDVLREAVVDFAPKVQVARDGSVIDI